MCAVIFQRGVMHHRAQLGPNNTPSLLTFPDELKNIHILPQEEETDHHTYVAIWDNVKVYRAALVHDWFANYQRFVALYFPPYSLILNLTEQFFLAWWWKAYKHRPHECVTLLQVMEDACDDIHANKCHGWAVIIFLNM